MLELTFALMIILSAIAFSNWRRGLAICVLMAILQDPLRKLTPNEPAYFVLMVGVVFAAAVLGAMMSRVRLTPNAIHGWKTHMGNPFTLYLVLVGLGPGLASASTPNGDGRYYSGRQRLLSCPRPRQEQQESIFCTYNQTLAICQPFSRAY